MSCNGTETGSNTGSIAAKSSPGSKRTGERDKGLRFLSPRPPRSQPGGLENPLLDRGYPSPRNRHRDRGDQEQPPLPGGSPPHELQGDRGPEPRSELPAAKKDHCPAPPEAGRA